MTNRPRFFFLFVLFFFVSTLSVPALAQNPTAVSSSHSRIATTGRGHAISPVKSSFGSLALHFEENRGQTDSRVQFLARASGYTLFLTPTETVFALHAGRSRVSLSDRSKFHRTDTTASTPSIFRMKLSGAHAEPASPYEMQGCSLER
jgi:hypothetical protein